MLAEIIKWRLLPKERRLPLYLVVFVTYRCNSRCRTCFYSSQLTKPAAADLPLEFYVKLAKSLNHLTWLHLSGGEPFLRQDLPQLVQAFYQYTGVRRIGIPTNALLSERILESTEKILDLCPEAELNIVVSLDGMEETHDYIRGVPGNWQKTLETIEALKKLQKKYQRLSINICTVLNNRNEAEIPELLEFVKNLGVNFHDVGLLRGDFPDKSLELPSVERVAEVLFLVQKNARFYYAANQNYSGIMAKLAAKIHRYLNLMFIRFLSRGKLFQPCLAGDGFAVIEPSGEVKLCELTPVIGSLQDFDGNFASFWQQDKIKELRSNGICKLEGCTHSNFQTRNFLLNPSQWWRALL